MSNLLIVLVGTGVLMWVFLLQRPSPSKMLTASRWMLLAWGMLLLVHLTSPITFIVLHVSTSTWIYMGIWVAAFCLADNIGFKFRSTPRAVSVRRSPTEISSNAMRICATIAFIGACLLVFSHREALDSDAASLTAALRNTQLGDDSGLLKTVATILACLGLPVALIEICRSVRDQTNVPIRAGVGLISYLSVTFISGGRPGFVMATVSVLIAMVSSVYLSGLGFAKFRKTILIGGAVATVSAGYIMFVVSTRSVGYKGDMDNKIRAVNLLFRSDLDPTFRESVRPMGIIGDTVIESYYYLGTQFPGLDYVLHNYKGPFGGGLTQVPYLTRRIESLFGVRILDPIDTAHNHILEKIGVFPHYFETGAEDTILDFGVFLSIPFVFFCGALSRRARIAALQSRSPVLIALQALICCGAAWTIIFSPFDEQSWSFPLLWFIGIRTFISVRSSLSAVPNHVAPARLIGAGLDNLPS
jgi:hypothetical protein